MLIKEFPEMLIQDLISKIEIKLKKFSTLSAKIFLIQYTYFEYWDNEWRMKTFLDIGNEKIEYINLNFSNNDVTYITVHGQNPNFGILKVKNMLDMRGKSTENIVYASDLYIDFEPCHFYGKCYTTKQRYA